MNKTTFRDFRRQFINAINARFKPRTVYYPACGADSLPKEVFGNQNVIHLSLPQDNIEKFDYFSLLGEGIKLFGDMDNSPLTDQSVDLIWLKLEGIVPSQNAIKDFSRVLTGKGHIVLEEYRRHDRKSWEKLLGKFSGFERVSCQFADEGKSLFWSTPQKNFLNPKGFEEATVLRESQDEMIKFVSSHQGYQGLELIIDRAVFLET